ncbi:hypothetical protein PHLGIDRAFT_75210 [Phlebiopsis gigantea 11061_1 CR5-6]|uniref:CAP-Gly domain-containing protein n=1 Tax=Phlebiopsis gigantea (strain 11061_1 CR5-6) TaxID=745531 RepID=A0A0C3RUS9_PHLG1|nr:hypothetical protein PHLGIDRAFT_75210 [Phlebiopsis gigantea 11061_1 CR5-6]
MNFADRDHITRSVKDALLLVETEETWDRMAAAINTLHTLLREDGGCQPRHYADLLHSLSSSLNKCINSERSRLSGAAIDVVACLQGFNPPDLQRDARGQEVEALIKSTATDANADIRKISKRIFEAYTILLPGRVDRFVAPLTPTIKKYLAVTNRSTSDAPFNPPSRPSSSIETSSNRARPLRGQGTTTNAPDVAVRAPSRRADDIERQAERPPSRTQTRSGVEAMPPPVIVPSRPRRDDAMRERVPTPHSSTHPASSFDPLRPRAGPMRPSALSQQDSLLTHDEGTQAENKRPASRARRVLRPEPSSSDQPSQTPDGPTLVIDAVKSDPMQVAEHRSKTATSHKIVPAPSSRAGKPPPTKPHITLHEAGAAKRASKPIAVQGTRPSKADPRSNAYNAYEHHPSGRTTAPKRTTSLVSTQPKVVFRQKSTATLKPRPRPESKPASTSGTVPSRNVQRVVSPALVPLPCSPPDTHPPTLDQDPVIPDPITPRRQPTGTERMLVEQTPISALVESIQNGFIFTPAANALRAGQAHELGDTVRIESLGFEGTLRFLGEIEGKAGTFAGVELGGGFAGKGKNDGSVGGKRYFTCPPNCGVFIATSKLSPSTSWAVSISRPSSVASSRNGRVTPSLSGRATPSFSSSISTNGKRVSTISSGRITPASQSGRITPSASIGRRTPGGGSANTRSKPATTPKSTVPLPRTAAVEPIITPGSRAAGRSAPGTMGPPTGTPTRTRTMTTPRARLSSNASMPPPSSPSSHRSASVSLNDPIRPASTALSDLSANQRAIQDMIDRVARPASSASVVSRDMETQLQLQIDRLQSKLDTSDVENKRLRANLIEAESSVSNLTSRIEASKNERDQASSRVSELEASLRTAERALSERSSVIESLQRAAEQSALDIEKVKNDGELRIRDIQSKLDDKEFLVTQLKELVDAKEGLQSENDAVIAAKNAEIAVLETRVQKAYAELEEERRELGGQVDELRKAGQETIALYEERLSAADSRRYEMEDHIASLEEQLQDQARPVSPSTLARRATSALEIDNETLREQVQHLQKKIGQLEDMLEDARVATEREEQTGRDPLEDSVEQTLLREEQALEAEEAALNGTSDDVSQLQKTSREMKSKYEIYREVPATQLVPTSFSLVYIQDELEREVSRLQERLAKSQKKSSKNGLPDDSRSSMPSMSSSASSRSQSVMSNTTSHSGEDLCEICERPGHDIFSCDLLKDDRPLAGGSISAHDFLKKSARDDLYCEDCEEHGHISADCPHSLDIF